MKIEKSDELVIRVDDAGITTLTLNRPDQYNALSEEMIEAVQARLDAIARNESVRVVILAASGRAFCAGHDLKQMRSHVEKSYFDELFARCGRMMKTVMNMPQPVIARVHGMATAAGCQLVATCDLAVASDNARFAVSGINVGLFCSTPSVALGRNVGRKKAMEMLLTGKFISAAEAELQGLINSAVPAEQLDDEISKLAQAICAKSTVAIKTGKQMFYKQLELGVEGAYEFAGQTMACNMMSEDCAEGIDAFMQKRDPVWKGK